MLHRLKKLVPKPFVQGYHWSLAYASAMYYRYPSKELIVIGVTGTNGKSSTVQLTAQLLTLLGERVGYTTTAGFKIAGESIENKMKITMPGRFTLQALLRRMVDEECKYAIVETSSQGILQFRHLGIQYDAVLITNLTPEHIEAHGGFEAYREAKGRLFTHLMRYPQKKINGTLIPRTSLINMDDEHAQYYANFKVDRKLKFSWSGNESADVSVQKKEFLPSGANISIEGVEMKIPLGAEFQQKNVLAAVAIVRSLGFSLEEIAIAVEKLEGIPGRFEVVDRGQPFHVIIDYAYEPYALRALLADAKKLQPNRIIGVHGSAGGGRDRARRAEIGRLAAEEEDVVIVTNEDPYDEDPVTIIQEVGEGARNAGKVQGEDLYLIEDRMEAIEQAIALAQEGDVVLLTGKGSEPVMAVANGKKVPWNDKDAAVRALIKRGFI